jgi:mannose-6-phosphate isomerase-like protein (cupin superfamily)
MLGVMVDLGWPWWVTTLIAAGVVVAASIAFALSRNPAVRGIAALLFVQGVVIAIVAPFVMDEGDHDEAAMMQTSGRPAGSADELFSPPQASSPAALRWGPVPGVPKGMEGAGLYGNPSKRDLYALRIRLPDGYFMPPHLQPEAEILTVIHGTLIVGLGEGFDRERAEVLRAGSVSILPARRPHYFRSVGETIVQVEGIGPLDIEYVNPADAPDE